MDGWDKEAQDFSFRGLRFVSTVKSKVNGEYFQVTIPVKLRNLGVFSSSSVGK